jgi:hypothetical protein
MFSDAAYGMHKRGNKEKYGKQHSSGCSFTAGGRQGDAL